MQASRSIDHAPCAPSAGARGDRGSAGPAGGLADRGGTLVLHPDEVVALHRVVVLRGGERRGAPGLAQRGAGQRPGIARRAARRRCSRARRTAGPAAPAVAQRARRPCRPPGPAAPRPGPRLARPSTSSDATSPVLRPRARPARARRQHVVPDQLGERLGQFLQPGVVGATARPRSSGPGGTRRQALRRGRRGAAAGGSVARARRATRCPATKPSRSIASQRGAKAARSLRALPMRLQQVRAACGAASVSSDRISAACGPRTAGDRRLHEADRAVDRAGVAPGFQRMRQRQVPVASQRGLVVIAARRGSSASPGAAPRRSRARRARRRPGWRPAPRGWHRAGRHRRDQVREAPGRGRDGGV